MKKAKTFLVVAAASLLACGVTSCNSDKDTLVVCLASEPASIDPALNSAVDGATMLVHLNSGLVKYTQGENGNLKLVNDLAKEITKVSASVVNHEQDENTKEWKAVTYPNGVRYTITLRDDIKWSNGDKITTDDFIWSWNRASGSTLGGDYCYMFEQICDGVYHESDDAACPTLGIKKVNDTQFTVDLYTDIAYFDQLLAFPTYQPVHKATVEKYDTVENGTWATDPSTYVSSGAYILKEWEHNSYITIEKNNKYWDAKSIVRKKITFALSDDDAAILASYQSGAYSFIDSVPNEQIDDLKAQYPDEFTIAGQMGTYYVSFNVNSTVFTKATTEEARVKVRKALGLLIDRNYIVKEIGKCGQIPANAFVSAGLSDPTGGEFVDHNGTAGDGSGYYDKGETDEAYAANVQEAIKLLKEVGYTYDETTKKFTDFPTFKYIYNTSSTHKAIAENLKDTWAKYGINANIENYDWSTFLDVRKEGQYDVARNGWLADYDDPSSYLSMWTTASGNNDCQFGRDAHGSEAIYSADINRDGVKETGLTWSESYDKLMDLSNKESDSTKRFEILHEIEDLLMETGAICPIYFYTDLYMMKTNISGFFSSPLGYKFFMYTVTE